MDGPATWANIEVEGTQVGASTLHNTFDFDGSHESKLDFSKRTAERVNALIALDVLLLDEVSMLRKSLHSCGVHLSSGGPLNSGNP